MRNVDTIVVHYSATYTNQDVSLATIQQWHLLRGFAKVGYHGYIKMDGSYWQGRSLEEIGEGVKSQNTNKLHLCYEGGLIRSNPLVGQDTRTPAQIDTMIKTIRDWQVVYPNATKVLGHKDLAATQCPGFDVRNWWRSVVEARVYTPEPRLTTHDPVVSWPLLKRGSFGNAVLEAQIKLEQAGFTGTGLDGKFGGETEKAVRKFQTARDLFVDGKIGPSTWAELLGKGYIS